MMEEVASFMMEEAEEVPPSFMWRRWRPRVGLLEQPGPANSIGAGE
jgi:hypothetical protein